LELVALRVAACAGTAVAAKAATTAAMAAVARRRLTIQRIGPGPKRDLRASWEVADPLIARGN